MGLKLRSLISFCIKDNRGQSTVEFALLFPAFSLVLLLLLQPLCIGYSQIVMQAAACKGARLLMTQYDIGGVNVFNDEHGIKRAVTRTLRSVPYVDIFHIGGDKGWDIEFSKNENKVSICIRHLIKPLPLMGHAYAPFLERDFKGNFISKVELVQIASPVWVEE